MAILSKTKKGKDEKLSTYHGHFKHALEQCEANNVMPYNDHQLILLYLTNLKKPISILVLLASKQTALPHDPVSPPPMASRRKSRQPWQHNVTDDNGNPLYVRQGDWSDLTVQGMGPVTKVINNLYATRYMSYLVEDLGTPL